MTRSGSGSRATLAAGAVALALVACPSAAQPQPQPVGADDGVQIAGRLGVQQVNVSDGAPEVTLGDCDPNDGADRDLCLVTHTIEGTLVVLVIENPDALTAGGTMSVRSAVGCAAGCDDVTDAVVVEVRLDDGTRAPLGGTVTVREADGRYAASFVLRFDDGSLAGHLNVAA